MDWSDLTLVCDPRVGQQITTLHPVLSIAFYLRAPNYAALQNFYDSAMLLVKGQLTHYQAEEMKRPSAITPRAFSMVPAWLRKPKEDHAYWWKANGGSNLGCAPPEFELFLRAYTEPDVPPERTAAFNRKFYGIGDVHENALTSVVRLALPVDHPLGNGEALRDWLLSLELLKSGDFTFGECGYGLSSLYEFGGETESRERAACSRYPGLDCFRVSHVNQMFRVDPAYPDLIPLVKRAAWTTVLHEQTIQYLGGEELIRSQLADTPDVRAYTFEHGMILQAGERPQLGDLNRGDFIPLVRKVAKVLRPARVNRLAEESAFWEHFFTIYDKEYV